MASSPLLAQIRLRRELAAAAGRPAPRRLKRPLRIPYPRHLEREYEQLISRELLRPLWALTREQLLAELPGLVARARADAARLDRDDEPWREVVRRIGELRAAFERRIAPERLADEAGRAINRVHLAGHQRQVKHVFGVDIFAAEPNVARALSAFAAENVSLIKSIPAQYFDQVEQLVQRSLRAGRRVEAIAADIEERFGVTESRAALIAADQVGKLNGQLTKVRQEATGVRRYIWRTSMDERVRSEHRDREGEVFSWDDPPEDGHPGEPIRCRCFAEPIFDDIDPAG